MIVRARFKDKMADIVYDQNDGIECLGFQIAYVFETVGTPLLVDFVGRQILTCDDIEDIKVFELIQSLRTSIVNVWVIDSGGSLSFTLILGFLPSSKLYSHEASAHPPVISFVCIPLYRRR